MKTAVQWFEEALAKNLKHIIANKDNALMESLFEHALELEKQQIIEAYDEGEGKIIGRGEQYYKQNYEDKTEIENL